MEAACAINSHAQCDTLIHDVWRNYNAGGVSGLPLGFSQSGLMRSLLPKIPSMKPSSSVVTTVEVSMSPEPVQSRMSKILGLPSDVVWSPAAPGSTPVSKTAMITPLPS